MPAAAGAAPFGQAAAGPTGTDEADRPFAPVPGADAILEEDDDEVDERPRHPYTWLHLIVLAVVAFVLGFLIVLLLNKASDDGASDASAATPTATTTVTSTALAVGHLPTAAALVVPT